MPINTATELQAYEAARDEFLSKFNAIGRRYFSQFMKLKCAPDLLVRKIFPNSKEITESFGAYNAVKYLPHLQLNDPSTVVVCVGDGRSPRTAATFAFRSAWKCISVDPNLADRDWKIDRLQCVKKRIEDTRIEAPDNLLVVAVHSHAFLSDALKSMSAPRISVIAIPCCVPQVIYTIRGKLRPDRKYRDMGILSPKNEVLIWDDVRQFS